MKPSPSRLVRWSLVAAPLILFGCSDGNSKTQVVSGTSHLTGDAAPTLSGSAERTVDAGPVVFELTSISAPAGSILELNRDIELTFNRPLDMASVSLNTIQIRSALDGRSAVGTFAHKRIDRDDDGVAEVVDRRVLVFSPRCPVEEDYSDAGLRPGTPYAIELPGLSSGASNTLRSADGRPLATGVASSFATPGSLEPAVLFVDKVPGPPVPIVRPQGSGRFAATRVELGGDVTNVVHFELDADTGEVGVPAGFALPLNLYSDASTQVAFEVFFNQMVGTSATNLGPDRLRLEFQDAGGAWRPLGTRAELVANCDTALVRLEPVGILPAGCPVRAVVLPGFQDVVGQTNLLAIDAFAQAPAASVSFTSLSPADALSDELLEEFQDDAFDDTAAADIAHPAEWGDGSLTGSLGVGGGGGPGGDFDWVVQSGEIFFFDTTATLIVGGPGGLPTTVQNSVNGIVDVRDLIIEEGGEIRVQGPNPMQVNASRHVILRGELNLSGFRARDVATLNTGNQPELGGAGVAGGGSGGIASGNTTGTTLRGGTGFGAFQAPGLGGQGGESQFAPAVLGKDARRPGGGGGGRFALDACDPETDPDCNPPFGLAAEAGFDGHPLGTGAETGMMPAQGGEPGPSVFVDGDPTNDFFGLGPELDEAGRLVGFIHGELPALWAGAGGGGGGDAIPGVPDDPWNPGSDEKGGPGGGASGGLHVRALDTIVFGAQGVIRAQGGIGGTGENTIFLDHIGGSGGSGSGGHVVLESARRIDFTDGGTNLGAGPTTWISAIGGPRRIGPVTSGGEVSYGGAGGPGVIQLNVPKPNLAPDSDPSRTNIVVPLLQASARDPLELVSLPASQAIFASIGAVSAAQSTWISTGEADKNPAGGADLVAFLFRGLDDQGRIATTNETVDELAPLLAGNVNGGGAQVAADAVTLVLSGAALDPLVLDTSVPSNDLYLRTPALLRHFALRLAGSGASQEYEVVAATYDDAGGALALTVANAAGTLQDFLDAAGGSATYELVPRFFRVATGGVVDALPDTASVTVRFQATGADALGRPDDDVLVDWTSKIEDFNTLAPGELQYFRFQVEFDLDAAGVGVTPDLLPVSLDFLRVPFRF